MCLLVLTGSCVATDSVAMLYLRGDLCDDVCDDGVMLERGASRTLEPVCD